MYSKECKWCKETITVEKQPHFASHVASCRMNPNFEISKKKSSERLKGVNIVERIKVDRECPRCGELFTVEGTPSQLKRKDSKKYCSEQCAHSRKQTEETKEKIRTSVKQSEKFITNNRIAVDKRNKKYLETNKKKFDFVCLHCGEEGIDKKYNKNRKYHKECWLKVSGGVKPGSSRGKCGWYSGYWCDSSYELAYLIYCLENNIDIVRNKEGFEYIFNDEKHLFYPDFIVSGKYVEIKNFRSDLTDAKLSYFPYDITVYYKDTIKPYLEYTINKYGKDFIKLYEVLQEES